MALKSGGAFNLLFAGASGDRGAAENDKEALPEAESRLPSGLLVPRLHSKFCKFQVQAKRIQDTVEATQMPVDSGLAEDILQHYSCSIADELRHARDELRKGKWDIDPSVRQNHDMLCVCLAVWELVHELTVSTAPSAARLLHWYNRHYLEEEIAEWWQTASQWASDREALKPDSPFWEPLIRLALADCRTEVLSLLQRAAKADQQVVRVCEFLRKIPSMMEMEQAQASKVELHEAMGEIQAMAQRLLAEVPSEHPVTKLLKVYAGSPLSAFEANEDIAADLGRTWVEDMVYGHAWVLPELRRTELGDLLKAVAQRRTSETIDDIDRVLFKAISLDVPALLRLLESIPDRFPAFFVTHLVDVLYFAGRVPLVVESEGSRMVPPRDWHLMQYSQELRRGSRAQHRLAIDYLRAGGSEEAARQLESAASEYCATASSEAEMDEAVALLLDLDLAAELGPEQCRKRSAALRTAGDITGCLRWACQAEQHATPSRGYHVSELLDSLAENDNELEALLTALTPSDLDEPPTVYPPASLLALLSPSGAPLALAPSGRLYFFVQYARSRALRRAGRPASQYAPVLVELLTAGVAGPSGLSRSILEDELLPALREEVPALSTEEALRLMRYVQGLTSDPLRRGKFSVPIEELHQAMGACLSRAIMRGPACASALGSGSGAEQRAAPAPMQGITA